MVVHFKKRFVIFSVVYYQNHTFHCLRHILLSRIFKLHEIISVFLNHKLVPIAIGVNY